MVALPGYRGEIGSIRLATTDIPLETSNLLQPEIVLSGIFPGYGHREIAELREAAVLSEHSPLWEIIGHGLKVLNVDITAPIDEQNLSRIAYTLTSLEGTLNENGVLPLLISNTEQFPVIEADFAQWLQQFIIDGSHKGQIVIPGLIQPGKISGHWAQVNNSMFSRSKLYKAMQSPTEAYGWLETIANTYSNLM